MTPSGAVANKTSGWTGSQGEISNLRKNAKTPINAITPMATPAKPLSERNREDLSIRLRISFMASSCSFVLSMSLI